MMPRLAARVWVDAYLRRLDIATIPAHVAAKGDPTAGTVMVKVATMDGAATCFQRSFDLATGERAWVVLAEGGRGRCRRHACPAAQVRPRSPGSSRSRDPKGRHLLDEDGLSS